MKNNKFLKPCEIITKLNADLVKVNIVKEKAEIYDK